MKHFLIAVSIIMLGLTGCANDSTGLGDLLFYEHVDLTGTYLTDITIEKWVDGERIDDRTGSNTFVVDHGIGPVTEWFGVPGAAIADRVVFDTTRQPACLDPWCDFSIQTSFTGTAKRDTAILEIEFAYDFSGVEYLVEQKWFFTNIQPYTTPDRSSIIIEDFHPMIVPIPGNLTKETMDMIHNYNSRR